MESSLSCLSSLKEDDAPLYIQPHYKESYRLAIYALLCGGKEAYEEFLRAEQISHLLSEEEILFILENAELPVLEDESEANRVKDAVGPSTYFPVESDEEVPDLELGWPDVCVEGMDTSISLLFHPPRQNTPSIKDVIRKQIQEARQVIAIAMDVFTDVDIFKEIISATLRGVAVYMLLDDTHFSSFLAMAHRVGINIQDLKNIRVRTVKGQEYKCRSGVKFNGDMEQKFILVDCRTVMYGTYSYTWSFEKINLSMVLVITGQLVSSYDEEFRRLYARSTVPAVETKEMSYVQYLREPVILQSPNSSQLSLHQIPMRSIGVNGMRGAQDSRMTRGLSVQERLHQYHCPDIGNLVRGHSYGGELQKLNSLTRLRMGTKDLGVPGPPERMGSNLRGVGDMLLSNRSQQHLRHQNRYGADQNLIPFNSETSLHRWKMDTYLNDGDVPLDASCDAISPMASPYSSYTGLNEYQSQLVHNRSRDIKTRMEEMRQKRLSLQEFTNHRHSHESLRTGQDRPKFVSLLRGLDMNVAELEPNAQTTNHNDSEPNKEAILSDGQRSASHHDVKVASDRRTMLAYDWHEPLSRTTSAGDLDMKLKDPSLKLSHLQSGGLGNQHARAMESLCEIPEEKEGSNSRVNSSESAAFKDESEEIRKDEKAVPKESLDLQRQDQTKRSHGSIGKVTSSSGSAAQGQKTISNEAQMVPNTSTGSQHGVEVKGSHAEKGQTQSEEPTFQRKNSMRMKVYSLLTSEEKKSSKKEEKSLQRKSSLRSKNPSGSSQPLKADHSQAPAADQTAKKGHSPSISRSQRSGTSEPERQKSPFPRLSTQRSSKRKTNLSAEQDRGSGSTLDEDGATAGQRQKAYSRFEYLLNEGHAKERGSSMNRHNSGHPPYQTQSGADNKLGRFMQRVGGLIGKNK